MNLQCIETQNLVSHSTCSTHIDHMIGHMIEKQRTCSVPQNMTTSDVKLTSTQCPVASTDDLDRDGPVIVGGAKRGAWPG